MDDKNFEFDPRTYAKLARGLALHRKLRLLRALTLWGVIFAFVSSGFKEILAPVDTWIGSTWSGINFAVMCAALLTWLYLQGLKRRVDKILSSPELQKYLKKK